MHRSFRRLQVSEDVFREELDDIDKRICRRYTKLEHC